MSTRTLFVAVLLTLVAATLLYTTSAQAGSPGKTAICHCTDNPENPYVAIEVSDHAVPAHEAHGDWVITEDAPCPPLPEAPSNPEPAP